MPACSRPRLLLAPAPCKKSLRQGMPPRWQYRGPAHSACTSLRETPEARAHVPAGKNFGDNRFQTPQRPLGDFYRIALPESTVDHRYLFGGGELPQTLYHRRVMWE